MTIWPTLFATQGKDARLEAIGMRPIFEDMVDADLLAGPPLEFRTQDAYLFVTADGQYFGVSRDD